MYLQNAREAFHKHNNVHHRLPRKEQGLISQLILVRDKDHVKIHKCPSGAYILTKYPFICNLLLSVIQIHSNCNFGTNCPKSVSVKHGSGGISPVAAYRSEQPGAVCQGCTAPPLLRWLALDWRHRLFYFPAARRGYILQSRPLFQDWKRAGAKG